jgi:hypothetical protein
MKEPQLIMLIASVFALASCMSIDHASGSNGVLSGMVYDYENRPVYGYEITLHPFRKTVTDINGHFSFPDTRFGTHRIEGKKNAFCPSDVSVEFLDPRQIVYLRVPSNDWVYCKIDGELASCQYDEAREHLAMLSGDEKKQKAYRLYSAILQFLESDERTMFSSYFKSNLPGRINSAKQTIE